jgi:hypothetical protein
MKNAILTGIILSTTVGCASMAVTPDTLNRKASFALGLNQSEFSIKNRVDDALETRFDVYTNSGDTYSCYVTGIVSITGRTVSDALCSDRVSNSSSKRTKVKTTSSSSCNALLQAAGRC